MEDNSLSIQIAELVCPYCFMQWGAEVIDERVVKLECGCGAFVHIKDLTCKESGGDSVVDLTYFIKEKTYLKRKQKEKNLFK